jgi:hypothetical protein
MDQCPKGEPAGAASQNQHARRLGICLQPVEHATDSAALRMNGTSQRSSVRSVRCFDERRGESNCESFVDAALEILSAGNNE